MNTAIIGKPVIDFTFVTTENTHKSFNELKGKTIVLYFYPKDSTPGCTIEARDFKNLYAQFAANNTYILGVSKDSLESHNKFKTSCGLPFPLISDEEEKLCHYFDVIKQKSMFGKKYLGIERSTFLIDQEGILRQEWRSVKVLGHAKAVLKAAQALGKQTVTP